MGLFCKSRLDKDKFCCHKTLNPTTFPEGGGKPCSLIPDLRFGDVTWRFDRAQGNHSIFTQGSGLGGNPDPVPGHLDHLNAALTSGQCFKLLSFNIISAIKCCDNWYTEA